MSPTREQQLAELHARGLGFDDITASIVLDEKLARARDESILPRQSPAIRAVIGYLKHRPSRAMWLYGPYGDGKTLALALLIAMWPLRYVADRRPLYLREYDVPAQLRANRRRLTSASLLAIDEVGTRALPIPEKAKRGFDPLVPIRELLQTRYDAGLFTVFATNPTASDKDGAVPKACTERYGGQLNNRWQSGGVRGVVEPWVDCGGECLRHDPAVGRWLARYRQAAQARRDERNDDEPITRERADEILDNMEAKPAVREFVLATLRGDFESTEVLTRPQQETLAAQRRVRRRGARR